MQGDTRPAVVLAFATLALGACTSYESAYEKAVYDFEPVYCYQSIGGVDCYRTAHRRDDLRLVNYYGPAPSKYEPPEAPEMADLQAPPTGRRAYRDPETDSASTVAAVRSSASSGNGTMASGQPAAGDKQDSDWKTWLPLLSVGFGALQVVAAFLM